MTIDPNFLAFLEANPALLSQFIAVLTAFFEQQNAEPVLPPAPVPAPGPKQWNFSPAGQPAQVPLTTEFITHEQIDALQKGYAEAAVKERAIEFVKGFLMALLLAAPFGGGPLAGIIGSAGSAAAGGAAAGGAAAGAAAECPIKAAGDAVANAFPQFFNPPGA